MDLERYADKRERYPLPEQMESAGNVVDPVTGHVLSVGIMTYRRTYAQVGYVCDQGAPKELHACVCSMLEQIQGGAVIKAALLRPEAVYEPICVGGEPTKELIHYAEMALCAMEQALKGYLKGLKEGSYAV